MAITGYLSEFSLAEIFQLLEQGHKTGLLTIRTLMTPNTEQVKSHYIWLNQGRIIAAADCLNQKGLLYLISKRGWLGDRAASRLSQACSLDTPMGICLKSQGVLQAEQLKLLFYSQVMRQVCALFELKDAWFEFNPRTPLPTAEMTGLSAPATDVTLAGLRALRDWSALSEKLPSPTSALISIIAGKPQARINQTEWQVWEYTNGTVTLEAIAEQLRLPVEKVQQVAFRLIVVGLVEEIPMITTTPFTNSSTEMAHNVAEETTVSQSFLQNLVGFLKGKV